MQYNIEDTSWNILDTGGGPPLILERSLNILERSSTYSNEYIIKISVRLYPYQLLAYIGMLFYLSNFFITKKHLAYRVLFLQFGLYTQLAILLAHPISIFCYNSVIISVPKKITALDLVRNTIHVMIIKSEIN